MQTPKLVSDRAFPPRLQMAAYPLCALTGQSGVRQVPKKGSLSIISLVFSSLPHVRTLAMLNWGPTLMTSFNLNYRFIDPVSKYSTLRTRAPVYGLGCG